MPILASLLAAAALNTMVRDIKLTAVSYNIRHGKGMDDQVMISRVGDRLAPLKPDFVGLQEVDKLTKRCGDVDQASELGTYLGMNSAFGAFMPYDGGEYGLAILSRYPIRKTNVLRLPDGEEPRVALIVEAELPSGGVVAVVNVHFDWIGNDKNRFLQATSLRDYLKGINTPYILMGDFNDEPESRTLSLFREIASEVPKPKNDHFTFSSTNPEKEIDIIFTAPTKRWGPGKAKVLREPLISDHRPIVAELKLKPE